MTFSSLHMRNGAESVIDIIIYFLNIYKKRAKINKLDIDYIINIVYIYYYVNNKNGHKDAKKNHE
jgi:hypothetical protein